jgi:hypothetical protein
MRFSGSMCMELRPLANYSSRSLPSWQNYDSTPGVRSDGRYWGRGRGRGSGHMNVWVARGAVAMLHLFLCEYVLYMRLQLASQVRCELKRHCHRHAVITLLTQFCKVQIQERSHTASKSVVLILETNNCKYTPFQIFIFHHFKIRCPIKIICELKFEKESAYS